MATSTDIAYTVMAPLADDDEDIPEDYAPAIVAESTMTLKTMSVASAVIELDTKDSPVFVFRNAGNDHLNIVYRRPDGNIGWIDPSTTKVAQRDDNGRIAGPAPAARGARTGDGRRTRDFQAWI